MKPEDELFALRKMWPLGDADPETTERLFQLAERLATELQITRKALRWFRNYPEFVPNPEFQDRVLADIKATGMRGTP